MREELESALIAAQTASLEELPRLLGDLEEVRAIAMARLIAPASPHTPDMLLEVDKAAERLGVSCDYLYRNHRRFPFTRRMGRALRFSAHGIEQYLKR
jgi:predicted DNA-binding transcriptional regulator AlpA